MHQMKKLFNIILTLWLFLLHPVLPSQWVDTLPSYSDPDGNPFQNVVVDHNNTGDVYVGGRNVVYHFSADLDLKQRVASGPMLDGQRSMDNHNSLLKMVYHLGSPPSLLFCGTAYERNCQVIATTNLTESHWIHPHNDSVTRTGPFQNRAVFGLGYNDQWTLFTATTENQLSRASSSVPFLTSKLLTKEDDGFHFRYAFHNATTSSTLALKHRSERIVIDGGFAHETFIYFLLHIAQGGDLSSRLARFCTKEATFQSYAELALECIHEGRTLTLSTAMDFGDSPDSDEKSLYAIFDKPGGRSVLCVFPWSRIVESFTTSPRYCNRDLVGKPCAPGRKEIADFCGPDVTPYIISRPLVTNLAPFEIATKINVIIVLKQQKGMVAIVGSGGSSIRKLNLSTGAIISSNEMDQTIKRPFRSPFVLDQKRQNIYLLLENKIIKYPLSSCGIYATCRECLSRGRSDPLGCGWCGGERCTHPEECGETDLFSRHTCSPVITDVSPLTGPIQGGIVLDISGENFGSYNAGTYSVTVADIPCTLLSWKESRVTCVLGPAPVGTYGPVELSIATNFSSSVGYNVAGSATSEQNFTYYVGARLFGIRPGKGPTSGGTNVTLVGENLDFDNDKARLFIIRQRLCTFDRFSADRNTVYCITGNETKIEYPDTIAVLIGDATYALEENPPLTHNVTEGLSQTFQYTEDPKITQITPGITTKSGLMNVTAKGTNLDSVQFPKMVVSINISSASGIMEIQEDCWSDPASNGTSLTCRTPSLLRRRGVPIPTGTQPLSTHVTFVMDAVQSLRDLSKQKPDMTRLIYYPDPEFRLLQGIQKMSTDDSTLEIKGNYLELINSADNFQVKLGEDEACAVTTPVSVEYLLCDVPSSLLQNSSIAGENITVSVQIGYRRRRLGYIQIAPVEVKSATAGYFWFISLLIIPALGILFAYALHYKNRKKKLQSQFAEPLTYQAGSSTTTTTTDYASYIQHTLDGMSFEMPILVDSETMTLLQDKNLLIPKDWLLFGEKVGAGQFGCVFEGTLQRPDQEDEARVAIKTLREHAWSNPQSAETFLREALIMKDFDHPNVLHLMGICFEGSGPSIVLPFMENGDLCSYLKDDTKILLVSNLLQFAMDVAAGMAYLAEKKFVHRDLAARNCILDSFLSVKVADFGLSRDVYTDDYYCCENKKAMLPYRWMAPESLEKSIYSAKTDVWSYGILLWELMTRGSIPYANVGSWDVLQYVKLGNRLDQPERCPIPIYRVMLACWNKDSKKRPSFSEIQVYLDQIQQWLLCATEEQPESVPAQHTMYYNSKEMYHNMEDQVLEEEIV